MTIVVQKSTWSLVPLLVTMRSTSYAVGRIESALSSVTSQLIKIMLDDLTAVIFQGLSRQERHCDAGRAALDLQMSTLSHTFTRIQGDELFVLKTLSKRLIVKKGNCNCDTLFRYVL